MVTTIQPLQTLDFWEFTGTQKLKHIRCVSFDLTEDQCYDHLTLTSFTNNRHTDIQSHGHTDYSI